MSLYDEDNQKSNDSDLKRWTDDWHLTALMRLFLMAVGVRLSNFLVYVW